MTRGREKNLRDSARPDPKPAVDPEGPDEAKTRRAEEPGEPKEAKGAPMASDPEDLLKTIADMLAAGLKTEVEPFPETDKEFADILIKLRQLDPNDLEGKLVIGGFVDHPYGPEQQRCMECMYFLVHRKWCDLPELAVPVEPEWWCRLWRI
jgi:hypothetical protein